MRFSLIIRSLILVTMMLTARVAAAQQVTMQRGSKEWNQYHLRQLEEVISEKTHLPGTLNAPHNASIEKFKHDYHWLSVNEELVSGNALPESEVHAAINPTDSSNIVVSPMRFDLTGTTTLIMPIYYSKDFGKSWKLSTFRAIPDALGAVTLGGGDPILAYDADGKLYLSWINLYISNGNFESAMYWAISTNGGATFTRPAKERAAHGSTADLNGFSINDKQWMTVDRTNSIYHNTLYLAYTLFANTGRSVLLQRKLPSRDSFELPTIISPDSFLMVQYTSIGVDRAGGVHVTFAGSSDTMNYALYHCLSTDGGVTFNNMTKISDIDIPLTSYDATNDSILGLRRAGNYPCPHLAIDTAGEMGRLYMVWSALGTSTNEGHGSDIYVSTSDDNGGHWTAAKLVNEDKHAYYCDHFYPTIAINGKSVVSVSWYDRRADTTNVSAVYYMAQSFDGGASWRRSNPVSTMPTDMSTVELMNSNFGIGEYTQIITTDHYAIPVWTDGRNGDGNLDIYAAFIPLDPNSPSRSVRTGTVAEGFVLHDNFPNPVTNASTIGYYLDRATHARLEIMNILGQVVRVLVNKDQIPGEYRSGFESTGLPNGAYYYRLVTNEGSVWRSMTVAK